MSTSPTDPADLSTFLLCLVGPDTQAPAVRVSAVEALALLALPQQPVALNYLLSLSACPWTDEEERVLVGVLGVGGREGEAPEGKGDASPAETAARLTRVGLRVVILRCLARLGQGDGRVEDVFFRDARHEHAAVRTAAVIGLGRAKGPAFSTADPLVAACALHACLRYRPCLLACMHAPVMDHV